MAKNKSRRLKNKLNNYEQKYCNSCKTPINQNCFKSKKMTGSCGSCYRAIKENIKRKITKKQSKTRKQERDIKTYLLSY